MKCENCKRECDEVCGGGYCRACHVSLTFEECVDESYVNRMRVAAGMYPMAASGEGGEVKPTRPTPRSR
jgi:hypothetical protein